MGQPAGKPTVSAGFDTGSIEVVSAETAGDIRVRLRPDLGDGPIHWFNFRVSGVKDQDCRILIENSNEMARLDNRETVPDCWTGYRPFASYDGQEWFRCDAEYENGFLTITQRPERDTIYFAYYPPYALARQDEVLGEALMDPRVRLEVLGQTPQGRDVELLRIGTPGAGKPKVWIMARQHPSETMAPFFMEGFLGRLLDNDDALARKLVATLDWFIVPTVNPDGAAMGLTRHNAHNRNPNRAWAEPDPALDPEVVMVRDRMKAEGVDFCLDAHGDEELPYVFLGGPLEIPSKSDRLDTLFRDYAHEMMKVCPAYDLADPYPGGSPEAADLRMAWNWIAEEFDCLSVLLEMPFKDTHRDPDPDMGWGPERCADFGRATLNAIAAVAETLR